MTTTEQYTIHDIVQMIKEDKLRLPTFQRNYVWEKTDIVKLFSTLFSDNTFGAISVIKTTTSYPIFSTRSFIDDLRDKYQLSEANYTPNYSPDDPLYLILDGQQRLQSFYLAFEGTFDNDELFFNTEDCTVGFYENCPNDNWIPIKKLYNKMSRSSYEQTAKFFGKEGNKSIFKFFYHIFFTKSITFLISEPINELEKDRERFTNLFIKVNASGKGLDKWEAYKCIIMGMRPETVEMFRKLDTIRELISKNMSKTKYNKLDYNLYSLLNIIYFCVLNETYDEYENRYNNSFYITFLRAINVEFNQTLGNQIRHILLNNKCCSASQLKDEIEKAITDKVSIESVRSAMEDYESFKERWRHFDFTDDFDNRVDYIIKKLNAKTMELLPIFIQSFTKLRIMIGIRFDYSDLIINTFRSLTKDVDNFNIQLCYINYLFNKLLTYFVSDNDCNIFLFAFLKEKVIVDLSYRTYGWDDTFYATKEKDCLFKLNIESFFSLKSSFKFNERNKLYVFTERWLDDGLHLCLDRHNNINNNRFNEELKNFKFYFDLNENHKQRLLSNLQSEFLELWNTKERTLSF
ncbi:MAG: DUF262 domain-containing protein [Bacteroidales bacterium]|nr:DUF262 domain-containing protein [Bacteroidales bacterium]